MFSIAEFSRRDSPWKIVVCYVPRWSPALCLFQIGEPGERELIPGVYPQTSGMLSHSGSGKENTGFFLPVSSPLML